MRFGKTVDLFLSVGEFQTRQIDTVLQLDSPLLASLRGVVVVKNSLHV